MPRCRDEIEDDIVIDQQPPTAYNRPTSTSTAMAWAGGRRLMTKMNVMMLNVDSMFMGAVVGAREILPRVGRHEQSSQLITDLPPNSSQLVFSPAKSSPRGKCKLARNNSTPLPRVLPACISRNTHPSLCLCDDDDDDAGSPTLISSNSLVPLTSLDLPSIIRSQFARETWS